IRKFLDVVDTECLAVHDSTLDDKGVVRLGEVTQSLSRLNDVPLDERDGGGASELSLERVEASFLGCDGGELVLHHRVLGVNAEGGAQVTELLHREATVLGQHSGGGVAESFRKFRDRGSLIRPCHGALLLRLMYPLAPARKKPRRRLGA